MRKTKTFAVLAVLIMMFSLTSCTRRIETLEQSGVFRVNDTAKEYVYDHNVGAAFFCSLNFNVESGKMLWQVYNPENELQYEGYATKRDGKIIKAITYPINKEQEGFNEEKVVEEVNEDFTEMYFLSGHFVGKYRMVLTPVHCKCDYKITWYNLTIRK